MSVAEIKRAAADLPANEQAELAAWLLERLPSNSGEDAISDSVAEARVRQKELDSGKSTLVSSEDFWKSVDSED
jgi:hypothetical protein